MQRSFNLSLQSFVTIACGVLLTFVGMNLPFVSHQELPPATSLAETHNLADSLALSPPCWVEDPAKLDDTSCYHLFEVAATYASYDLKLAYYVGLGNGSLVPLPVCEGGRTAHCSVELARFYSPSVKDQNFSQSYYRGFEEALIRRSPQPVEIECSTTACVLTYT